MTEAPTALLMSYASCRDDPRIELVRFERNRGVGAALAEGYIWARDKRFDVTISVDADGQMDWEDMERLIRPIADGRADFSKGNRLLFPRDWPLIPKMRLLGNAILSLLTKIASGYWSVADSQSGYVACSRYALDNIEWERLYKSYGRENDMLIRANVAGCRVADIPVRPVYGVGEKSTMNAFSVFVRIAFLLFRRFWWRLFHRYVLREFHPLVLFYMLAIVASVADLGMITYLALRWLDTGLIPTLPALAATFLAVTALNSLFFAFWMDMQVNEPLAVRVPEYFEIRSELSEEDAARDPDRPH